MFFEKNRLKQESEIDEAVAASRDTSEWEEGKTRRSPADLSDNNEAIQRLNIRDQHDAFYSIYNRGNESEMRVYNEMLAKKVSLHSEAVDSRISDAKFTAGYINPFKAFSEELEEGNFGKASGALLFSPLMSTLATGVSIYQGVQALREKIQLNKTRKALGLTSGVMEAMQ